ncbi:UNVERIFIED_CONTAM: hypothetical protein HDU68_000561, partial [Siphonaria sp. JEL0065]
MEMEEAGLSGTPSPLSADSPSPEGSFQTRILLDTFHAMKRISEHVSFSHVYRYAFVSRLRDAIFINDPGDQSAVEVTLKAREFPITLERMLAENPDWVRSRSRRNIPSPAVLVQRLKEVLAEFSKAQYANADGEPLLSEKA